jgi:hypothetical protein
MKASQPDPIILEAIARHEEAPPAKMPKKLTLVLGDFHLDLVDRIAVLTGSSKTEVVRRSLELWLTEESLNLLYPSG